MRRITIPNRSMDLLRARVAGQPSSYLCSTCKHQATSFSTSSLRAAREGKVPFTEKVRRKIWGANNPPGLKDPYGDKSVLDQTKKREQEEEMEEETTDTAETTAAVPAKITVPPDMSTYEPATSGEGLEEVGDVKDSWKPVRQFRSFLPAETVKDPAEITAALHRAVVEVFTLQNAGLPLHTFIKQHRPVQDFTLNAQIDPLATGATLQFPKESLVQIAGLAGPSFSKNDLKSIFQSLGSSYDETAAKEHPTESEEDVAADRSTIDPLHPESTPATVDETSEKENPTESEEDVAADRSTIDPLHPESTEATVDETSDREFPTESEEDIAADRSTIDPLHDTSAQQVTEELIASWGSSWKQVSLEDPNIKFFVLKRTMQLTGLRIPDSAIKPAKTVQNLLVHLIKPPKPRKLVEALAQKETLLSLANVTVYPQRITPIDKEKSVGRWKVIENELIERDLPVTGH